MESGQMEHFERAAKDLGELFNRLNIKPEYSEYSGKDPVELFRKFKLPAGSEGQRAKKLIACFRAWEKMNSVPFSRHGVLIKGRSEIRNSF